MYTYRFIGSFNTGPLNQWILENKRRLRGSWKINGHAIMQFRPEYDRPRLYKSLTDIHPDSIPDLDRKFPGHFFFIMLSESVSMYGRPTDVGSIYPRTDLVNNNEIPNLRFYQDLEGNWKFDLEMAHWANSETFTSENIYLDDADNINETKDTITLDFNNKKIISSIITIPTFPADSEK